MYFLVSAISVYIFFLIIITNTVLVNSHQRWKQMRNCICFHLWCELTLALWCCSIVWIAFEWSQFKSMCNQTGSKLAVKSECLNQSPICLSFYQFKTIPTEQKACFTMTLSSQSKERSEHDVNSGHNSIGWVMQRTLWTIQYILRYLSWPEHDITLGQGGQSE